MPSWNQDVKKAVLAKKNAFSTLLQSSSSSDMQSWYSKLPEAAAQTAKVFKEHIGWLVLGHHPICNPGIPSCQKLQLRQQKYPKISIIYWLTKYFGIPFATSGGLYMLY